MIIAIAAKARGIGIARRTLRNTEEEGADGLSDILRELRVLRVNLFKLSQFLSLAFFPPMP
jgi:hypothetical protein